MPEPFIGDLSQAVFRTVVYSDIFEYPLSAREVHRYLQGVSATYEEVSQALTQDPRYTQHDHYFALSGRERIVSIRKQRELHSQKLLPHALRYGKWIGSLPFVRMVALTGSLAVRNVSRVEDFDYMLVTVPGRLWTARAFALLLGRLTKLLGHTICPNLIVSESSLEWQQRDLYAARELCQMIPIAGTSVYETLMRANAWVLEYLPNATGEPNGLPSKRLQNWFLWLQRFLETALGGKIGDRLEKLELNRKIARFSKQAGFGDETSFTADICQGHFDHHHARTQREFQKRLEAFEPQATWMEVP